MDKKDLREIRKTLKYDNCSLQEIVTCFVDDEKNITVHKPVLLGNLPDDEIHKYLDIFKKSLSGSLGKKLYTVTAGSNDSINNCYDTHHPMLVGSLKDYDGLNEYFTNVVEHYAFTGKYMMLLGRGVYDVPGKDSNNEEMFDSSDEVYSFLIMTFCPVALSKAVLEYDSGLKEIHDGNRIWFIDNPSNAILYPAFSNRQSDISSILYYAAKPAEKQDELINFFIGEDTPLSSDEEKDWFLQSLAEIKGKNKIATDEAMQFHETVTDYVLNSESDDVSKDALVSLSGSLGLNQEECDSLGELFSEKIGEAKTVSLESLVNPRKAVITGTGFTLTIDSEFSHIFSVKTIDRVPCIVLSPVDNLVVNGIETVSGDKKHGGDAD